MTTSSVTTSNLTSSAAPKLVEIATSVASRPVAISTRPMRGRLCRASKVYHRPPSQASNQPLKSIGSGTAGTPMSPR